jgi:hypothetical protein
MPKPYLPPIEAGQKLSLLPAPNGGWIVEKPASLSHLMPQVIGAFGSSSQMLTALADALATLEGAD